MILKNRKEILWWRHFIEPSEGSISRIMESHE